MIPSFQSIIYQIIQKPEIGSLVFLGILSIIWGRDASKNYKDNAFGRGSYLSVISLLFVIMPIILAFFIAGADSEHITKYVDAIRWMLITFGSFAFVLLAPQSTNHFRAAKTLAFHLGTLFLGWAFGKWAGILIASAPTLGLFYFLLYKLTEATFPSSNPDDKEELKQKFKAFFWYIWSFQYPFWRATSSATRESFQQIKGNNIKSFGKPGLIWTHTHQVVARSTGINFSQIDGPGLLFTGKTERPVALVDLRTQLRPTLFSAVTKEGITLKAIIFISFQINRDDWTEWDRDKKHEVWRINPVLQKGIKLDSNLGGSFPYAKARVQAALSAAKINSASNEEAIDERHWDEEAVRRVLREAELVLAERSFDELWHPIENDSRGASALDEIGSIINKRAAPELEKMGVKLFGSRVVNYIIETDNPLYKQLEASWLSKWGERIAKIKFDGKITSEKARLQARMTSRSLFLETITSTLQEAKNKNVDIGLLRQLTTLNFISTLERLLENSSTQNPDEQTARIAAWGNFLLSSDKGDTKK